MNKAEAAEEAKSAGAAKKKILVKVSDDRINSLLANPLNLTLSHRLRSSTEESTPFAYSNPERQRAILDLSGMSLGLKYSVSSMKLDAPMRRSRLMMRTIRLCSRGLVDKLEQHLHGSVWKFFFMYIYVFCVVRRCLNFV
jgi:hypothetical protein